MEQKIIQVGNSTGVIIPKLLLEKVKLKTGEQVIIEQDGTSNSLIISKIGSKCKHTTLTPEFLAILERVNNLYGAALKELAEK